jgi:2-haloacid dehalogenase
MIDVEQLKRKIKVCMFDQYGTVVDIQGGLTEIAAPFLKKKGWGGDPNSFVTWWRRTHFENSMIDALLQREHTPYREIGQRAVAYVMDRAGISYTALEVHHLVASIERLKCFPEVPKALARLQTRYKLVVLSNGDPDMLEAAKKYHGIPFDKVISVAVSDFVAGRADHPCRLGKRYGGMAGDEERTLDAEPVEKVQDTAQGDDGGALP